MWLAHRGVLVFDGRDRVRLDGPIPASTQSDTKVTYEDREGNLWLGSWGGDPACCDPASRVPITRPDSPRVPARR